MNEILFNHVYQFEGRNGTFKCLGIAINDYETYITILPITSKGEIGRCMIDIERDKIDELIQVLNTIKNDIQDTAK